MNLGPRDKAARVQLKRCYDLHPALTVVDDSSWNDETLLAQLMLLADSGLHFHWSRLVNSPEDLEYQYIQVLFIVALDLEVTGGGDHSVYLKTIPKLLGVPNLALYVEVN